MTLFSIEKLYKNKVRIIHDLVISRAAFSLPGSQLVMQKNLDKVTDTQKIKETFGYRYPKIKENHADTAMKYEPSAPRFYSK